MLELPVGQADRRGAVRGVGEVHPLPVHVQQGRGAWHDVSRRHVEGQAAHPGGCGRHDVGVIGAAARLGGGRGRARARDLLAGGERVGDRRGQGHHEAEARGHRLPDDHRLRDAHERARTPGGDAAHGHPGRRNRAADLGPPGRDGAVVGGPRDERQEQDGRPEGRAGGPGHRVEPRADYQGPVRGAPLEPGRVHVRAPGPRAGG